MGFLDIDESKVKKSSKEEMKADNKKPISLPIGDSLLDEVNRNTQILINNPELVKVPKNILQNEYGKLEKQLKNYFNIEGLDIEVSIPLINNRLNVVLSLNTNSLLEEQKELVYNSIGTVFADKFDIEFKVKEDVGSDIDLASQIEVSFVPIDFSKTRDVLKGFNILEKSLVKENNKVKFYLSPNKENMFLVEEIRQNLERGALYDRQQKFKTTAFRTHDVARMARCNLFRERVLTLSNRSGYEPRGGSNDRDETIRTSTTSLGLREATFFKEKLNICIKGYDTLFKEAISDKDASGIEQLTNEFFKIFNIPNTDINSQMAFDDEKLSAFLKQYN